MTFDGSEYLVIIDYYTKMPFIRKMPPSQCNSAKTIASMKELVAEYSIPEVIRTDNIVYHLFTYSPSSPRTGALITSSVLPGTHEVMDKLRQP